MAKEKFGMIPPGLEKRIYATILGGIGFLIALILYLAFTPTSFSTFQSIAIGIVGLLVLAAIMTVIWVPWGMRFAEHADEWGKKAEKWGEKMEKKFEKFDDEKFERHMKAKHHKRTIFSSLSGIAVMIFVVLYLAFNPTGFTLFQNLAIIAVVFLLLGAVNVLVWVPAGMKEACEFEEGTGKKKK